MNKIFACAISIGFVATLFSQPRQFRDIQNNIGLCATVCSDEELIVDSDGWKLSASAFIDKGYTPVRVHIKNMSSQAVSISDTSIQYARPDIRQLIGLFECSEVEKTVLRFIMRTAPCVGIALASMIYGFATDNMKTFMGIFMLCSACQGINTFIITPNDYVTFQNLNKQLGSALRKALPTGSMVVMPGSSAEKIFLIPQDINNAFEFRVFGQHTDTAAATFCINIF